MGASAANSAPSHRSGKTHFTLKSTRKSHLDPQIPLSCMLCDRYGCSDWETFYNYVSTLDSYLNNIHATKSDNPREVKRLTPVEVLATFATSLESEVAKLKFDVFEAHRQALSCLKRVYSKMQPTLVRHMGDEYFLLEERELPKVVIDLFAIANGADQPRLGLRRFALLPSPMLQSRVLAITGAIVEQILKEENENEKNQGRTYRFDDESCDPPYVPSDDIPELKTIRAMILADRKRMRKAGKKELVGK